MRRHSGEEAAWNALYVRLRSGCLAFRLAGNAEQQRIVVYACPSGLNVFVIDG